MNKYVRAVPEDVDDLIFNYEAYHTSEDDGGSDR